MGPRMSEAQPAPDGGAPEAVPAIREPVPASPAPWRAVAFAFAGALVLIVALVGAAPLWAPLLPWDVATQHDDREAMAARIARLETAQSDAQQQVQQTAATTETALQRLDGRVAALAATPAAPAADLADLRQQIAKLAATLADLGNRVDALDTAAHARVAHETTDAALVMAALQIREAVAAGRPFQAQYEMLAALAPDRQSAIAQAALPLAAPAKTGVASQAVLADGLRRLAGAVAAGPTPAQRPAKSGWTGAMMARLRGLVRVRRLDDGAAATASAAAPNGPVGVIDGAERALAGGDLAAAVAALGELTGASAEAAAPWLRSARQRLAVDAALQRIEALATARLGAAPPAAAEPPGGTGPSR
jgi:hypothetical protein